MNEFNLELGKLIDICHANLKNSQSCINYLNKRGLDKSITKKYKIGYFPQNINKLSKYVSTQVLQKLNILDYSEKSKFSDFYYLVFPIFSEYKEPIAIGGRTLLNDDERTILDLPKYMNSAFKKSNYLYGLNNSRSEIFKKQNVYVVEGFFDQITLSKNNIKNSVAICGTAFSKNHMLKLTRYTDKITFILDRDTAGQKSMEKIYTRYCNQGIKLRFLLLPETCKDVDDYFTNGGMNLKDLESFIPTL